ncbi:Zn-ribbon domain-containing OB-fold protein [Natronosalvus amylolyticus]|uniref:Zn-ribbon domain-containing OB-fold protein n=1 Tax=Natronosalvus amylolyticus TaxID=2961994 RepID=UPI0020C985E1|nr:OB-fold domain-containing protein [Natronosalvus amylolyticus]
MSETDSSEATESLPEQLNHRTWTQALREGRLLGQRCRDCGAETATPSGACNTCGSRERETIELPTTGTLYTETTVAVAPQGFDGGYRVGIVDLGSTRVMARLEGDSDIGDSVELAGVLEVDSPVPVFE